MKTEKIIQHITKWVLDYSKKHRIKGFVIGISGGIDSAVTSILVAKTNMPVLCLDMPINQEKNQRERGKNHIKILKKNYKNVKTKEIDLSQLFNYFVKTTKNKNINNLALANTKARLRMTTLYYYAQIHNYIVIGTGNKVEDFGIGFFTKYGDGGVDISPIADLLKSEVYTIGRSLKISEEILEAPPTDGLWENNQTDEEQIGATYKELEWAMNYKHKKILTLREKKVLSIYNNLNSINKHKMISIPICKIPKQLK